MEEVLATLESQASTAMKNLEISNTTYKQAISSGLFDELSKPVTKTILLYMDQTKTVAEQVVNRVQVLRDTTSDPNFLQELKVANEMVVGALANSKNALKKMRKVVADAAQRREEKMEEVLATIKSQANTAMEILDDSHRTYKKAVNSGLADKLFNSVTKPILSRIDIIRKAAEHLFNLVQVMRITRADHNSPSEIDKLVGEVLTNSEAALGQMQEAIADANENKKARKEKRKEEKEVLEPEREEEDKLEMEDKKMGAIFAEIDFKAWTAKMNVGYSHIACREACASGLADTVFKDVVNQIISDMEKTSITAKDVRDRLQALRDTEPSPNLYKILNEVEEKAVDAMAKSEIHLDLMQEMVTDAEKRKNAREKEADEEEEARVEEVRKKARNEPGHA